MWKISWLTDVLLAFQEGLRYMVLAGTMGIKDFQKCGYIQVFWTQIARILFKESSNSIHHCALIGTVKELSYSTKTNLNVEDGRIGGRTIKDSGDWWEPGPDAGFSSVARSWDVGSEWALEFMFPDLATVSFCKRTLLLGVTLIHLPMRRRFPKGKIFGGEKKRHSPAGNVHNQETFQTANTTTTSEIAIQN